MKKTIILAFAAIAASFAFSSCQKNVETLEEETTIQGQIPLGFDAYQSRAVTKADTDIAALQASGKGFGVFAYYTDNNDYDGQQIPNFMWNQQVTYAASKWSYEPVKYWPNEAGETAIAEEKDRISFFAYAPYAAATPATGKLTASPAPTTNIVGFTRNNYAGDPLVKYVTDLAPATSVDLVWGTIPASTTWTIYGGTADDMSAKAGYPWLNIQRPNATSTTWSDAAKVKFQFEHALARLNVQIITDANKVSGTAATADTRTNVWVRSVSFEGFATEGALNLNNIASKKALWYGINGDEMVTGEEVVIYDGLKDGKEATATASNEKRTGLNAQIIQSAAYESGSYPNLVVTGHSGVTGTAQNLFQPVGADDAAKLAAPIYVIPTGDAVKITIAYDVETYDANLATKLSDNTTPGSSISNVITKTIEVSSTPLVLENGKSYKITLRLGLNSVEFDADVTAWPSDIEGTDNFPTNN